MLDDKRLEELDVKRLLDNRPDKDIYYLAIAFLVAQRSFDPSSKCGCVIVSKDNRILSTGYNGPLKNSDDTKIPLTRPNKYYHMLHSEENSILAYNGSHQDIIGSTAYVTGRPCHKCLRMLIQKGISKIVYGKNDTVVVDQQDYDAQKLMLEYHPKIEIIEVESNDNILFLLQKTIEYIKDKSCMDKNYNV